MLYCYESNCFVSYQQTWYKRLPAEEAHSSYIGNLLDPDSGFVTLLELHVIGYKNLIKGPLVATLPFHHTCLHVISQVIAPVIFKGTVIPVVLFCTEEAEERIESSVYRCVLLCVVPKMPL